jgi:hypothetical protein
MYWLTNIIKLDETALKQQDAMELNPQTSATEQQGTFG